MDNQKAFAIYAITIIAGTITAVTAAVLGQGHAFPPVMYMIEHLALSLLFRAAYKSFDGTNWLARGLDAIQLTGRALPTTPMGGEMVPEPASSAKAA